VSKKLMPRSIARSIISRLSASGSDQSYFVLESSPNVIQPRQSRLTLVPVSPSVVYSMPSSPLSQDE